MTVPQPLTKEDIEKHNSADAGCSFDYEWMEKEWVGLERLKSAVVGLRDQLCYCFDIEQEGLICSACKAIDKWLGNALTEER